MAFFTGHAAHPAILQERERGPSFLCTCTEILLFSPGVLILSELLALGSDSVFASDVNIPGEQLTLNLIWLFQVMRKKLERTV